MNWFLVKNNTSSMTEALSIYKEASLSEETKRRLKITAGVLGGAAVAGLGISATSPFVRAEAANFLRNIGKNIHKADLQRSLPPGAVQDAKRVEKLLLSKGIDPRTAKISVTGAGGTGKTTFSRALANRMGNRHAHPANIHKHLDTEIKRSAFGWDFTKYKPRAGTLSEQTHLLAQSDPKNYDVMIHLEKPVKTVKKQLLARGKGATQYPIEDYRKLQTNLRNAFDITDGKAQSVGSHIRVKIRPKGGFNADANLNKKLRALGISPKGMRRSDKLLSITQGSKSKYRGIPSYLRRDTLGALGGASILGGAAGGYAMHKQAAEYRKVTVNGKTIEMDKEIPLYTRIPKDPKKARAYFQRRIRATKQENWSHPQIAIPANYDISKIKGYSPTRFAIPLPGETPFTTSYRMGKLHAHKRGPVLLMHEDAHSPMGPKDGILTGALKTLKHTPEALQAVAHGIGKGMPLPVKLASSKDKLKVIYIDETGAGHRAQSNNVVAAARKAGIDAEAIDWSRTFGSRRTGNRYRKDYLNYLDKKSVSSILPLAKSHIDYHYRSTDKKKLDRFLKKNKDSAIMIAHPLLMGQFSDKKRPISMLHTDPVKWPGLFHFPSSAKRQHVGVKSVVKNHKDREELRGLAVGQALLQKKLPNSGKIPKGSFNITVSGGGEGLEVGEMAREILKSDLPSNSKIHAVAGRNTKLLRRLQRMAKKDSRLVPHGFAPLPSMMRESNLNVIRAHGTSYAETLTSGKPAVYYGPSKHLLDLQGTLTRNTAIYGGKETKYPHAVGHSQIAPSVSSAIKNYKSHLVTAKRLKKSYGDPGTQAAMGAVEFHRKHTKTAASIDQLLLASKRVIGKTDIRRAKKGFVGGSQFTKSIKRQLQGSMLDDISYHRMFEGRIPDRELQKRIRKEVKSYSKAVSKLPTRRDQQLIREIAEKKRLLPRAEWKAYKRQLKRNATPELRRALKRDKKWSEFMDLPRYSIGSPEAIAQTRGRGLIILPKGGGYREVKNIPRSLPKAERAGGYRGVNSIVPLHEATERRAVNTSKRFSKKLGLRKGQIEPEFSGHHHIGVPLNDHNMATTLTGTGSTAARNSVIEIRRSTGEVEALNRVIRESGYAPNFEFGRSPRLNKSTILAIRKHYAHNPEAQKILGAVERGMAKAARAPRNYRREYDHYHRDNK
jgi:UDP-N-acetylglucosamine:LPS N-acetylglucosamine transferase